MHRIWLQRNYQGGVQSLARDGHPLLNLALRSECTHSVLQSISLDVLILLTNATVAFTDFNTISLTPLSSRSSILNEFSQVFTVFRQEIHCFNSELIYWKLELLWRILLNIRLRAWCNTDYLQSLIEIIFIVRLGSANSVTVKVRWLLKVLFVWCFLMLLLFFLLLIFCCCYCCCCVVCVGYLLNGVFF